MFRIVENYPQDRSWNNGKGPKYYGPFQTYKEAKEKEESLSHGDSGLRNAAFVGIEIESDGIWFLSSIKTRDQNVEYSPN